MADLIRAALERLTVLARVELDAGRIPGQPAWERAMADALYALAAAPEGEPPSWCETDPEQRAWQAGREARDDAMLRRAALPPNYIDPEYQGEDLELLQTFYAACRAEGGTADEIHLRGLRAVLAARPTSPATPLEGEVAELVKWLRETADIIQPSHLSEHQRYARAAALLERRHPAPVPVSERLPGPGDCDADDYCWRWNTIGGLWARQPLARSWYEFESHWLPATALPLPAGEVQQ